MYDLKTILLAKRIRRKLDVTRLSVADIALLEIIKNASDSNPVRNATISNGIATFGGVVASQPLVSLKLNIPITQTGSGTPSPDNKRDFIGFGGVNIGQTSGYGEYFKGLLNGTYGFVDLGSLTWRQSEAGTPNMFYYVSLPDYKFISNNPNTTCDKYERANISVSTTDEGYAIYSNGLRLRIRDTDYSTVEDFTTAVTGHYLIYELAEPSTPVTPEQFATLCQAFGITGNTYTISFGQTVYSAILDVLRGKLTIPRKYIVYDGSSDEDWAYNSNYNFFNVTVSDYYKELGATTYNCNEFNPIPQTNGYNAFSQKPDESVAFITTNINKLMVKHTSSADLTEFKQFLSEHNMKLVYELAEPIEIDLTPTQITTLIGENVIFADVADVTECKYTRK